MKFVIDIPDEVKDAFDNASNEDINFSYYDYNSVIGKAIKNGTPLDDIKAENKEIKEILIMFINHINRYGELYSFGFDEKDRLFEIANKWLNERRSE